MSDTGRVAPLLEDETIDAELRAALEAGSAHDASRGELTNLRSRLALLLPPGVLPPAGGPPDLPPDGPGADASTGAGASADATGAAGASGGTAGASGGAAGASGGAAGTSGAAGASGGTSGAAGASGGAAGTSGAAAKVAAGGAVAAKAVGSGSLVAKVAVGVALVSAIGSGGYVAWNKTASTSQSASAHDTPMPPDSDDRRTAPPPATPTPPHASADEIPPAPLASHTASPARVAPSGHASPTASTPNESESAMLARAHEALLKGAPSRALALSSDHAKAYPRGALAQEREVIAIEALLALGRRDEARRRASSFTATYPGSSHRERIERLGAGD